MKKLVVYGQPECTDYLRTRDQLNQLGVEFDFVDILEDKEAADRAETLASTKSSPVVVFPDETWLVEPSNEALETMLTEKNILSAH